MFATGRLEKDTLICWYNGHFSNHFNANTNSNSLFNVGWYQRNGAHWCLIVCDGSKSNCGSRFINSSPRSQANLRPFMGYLRGSIRIILTTTRRINEGEELFYDYGELYTISD